ncbi:MAG: DUF2975 domain-containing protein [Bacteroidetes bacterium]|nr:MAG: DUF2975 domain-containing protein [Bacteroidota bacterium]
MKNLTLIICKIIKAIYYLSIGCFLLLTIFGILTLTNLISTNDGDHKFILDYKLNKAIVINQNGKNYSELENFKVFDSQIIIEKVKVSYNLKNQTNLGLLLIFFAFIVYGTVILILKSLLRILYQIKNNDPFSLSTIKDIRLIGFIILFITPLSIIIDFCVKFILIDVILDNNFSIFHNFVYHFDLLFLNSIFPGLIILILAEVFKSGFELKKEQELTI